ncbi:MAG: hypothetical protein U5J97_08040 [Trueperaceae bacterium]|nr:hypothetical protein [Trueperaceae bacterium]
MNEPASESAGAPSQRTFFSLRFFELREVAAMVERGAELPIVLVGDAVANRGGKLSEARIAESLEAAGALGTGER